LINGGDIIAKIQTRKIKHKIGGINYILHATKCLAYRKIFKINDAYVKEMCVLHHAHVSETTDSFKTTMEVWCWTTNSQRSLDLHIKWE